VRQAEHLHQIGQRAFAAVVLPVGVGDEAHRRVEGEIGSNGRLPRRIERQHALQAHQRVEDDEAARVEQQHGDGVGEPMLLAGSVDARGTIEHRLDRTQQPGQERPLAGEHARHVAAERRCQHDDDRAEQQDLEPADECHDTAPQNRSGRSSA
jgi:hypothetical protein